MHSVPASPQAQLSTSLASQGYQEDAGLTCEAFLCIERLGSADSAVCRDAAVACPRAAEPEEGLPEQLHTFSGAATSQKSTAKRRMWRVPPAVCERKLALQLRPRNLGLLESDDVCKSLCVRREHRAKLGNSRTEQCDRRASHYMHDHGPHHAPARRTVNSLVSVPKPRCLMIARRPFMFQVRMRIQARQACTNFVLPV